jgi:hypothetical protein
MIDGFKVSAPFREVGADDELDQSTNIYLQPVDDGSSFLGARREPGADLR